MNRLVIVGAGGHGKVVADIALKNGYIDVCFVDDCAVGECMGLPIIGKVSDITKLDDGSTDFVIGIGNNSTRMMIAETYSVNWVSLVHPSAVIGSNVKIGCGTVVMAGAIVNPCTIIGSHCIVNTGAIVEHDNIISDYVHLSPRATLSGSVLIGSRTWIGAGACIINNINICDDIMIAAGAVVIKDITDSGIYVGIPARRIK